MIDKKQYQDFVDAHVPRSPMWRSMVPAFVVGGIICMIGQGISDLIELGFPDMGKEDVASWTSVALIFLGSLLTALGIYDKIGHFAGGGSIVPITGFANSVVSPAIEYNREGIVFGICAKMFVIAGPIIVFGITASFIAGLIGLAIV